VNPKIIPTCHMLAWGLQSIFSTGEVDSVRKKLHWELYWRLRVHADCHVSCRSAFGQLWTVDGGVVNFRRQD